MSVNWGKAFDARHSYLKSQREILMKDL